MLPPETKAEIKRLFFAEHLTMNMIAEKLGVHHDTVKAAIEVERFHPRVVFRTSQMDAYVPFIIKTLEDFPKLRSTRLFQMLQDRGYRGSVQQLRRRVRDLRPKVVRAYLPQTVFAGEQAQVDWGHFGTLAVALSLWIPQARARIFQVPPAYSFPFAPKNPPRLRSKNLLPWSLYTLLTVS